LLVLQNDSKQEDLVRITTLLKQLIGVTQLFVEEVTFVNCGLVVRVRPRWHKPRCGQCGTQAPGYDQLCRRRWQHLPFGRTKIFLEAEVRRVKCATCGVRTEAVPWAAHRSGFTRDFEEMVAYLAQTTDKTAVMKLMGIAWRTVGVIVERVVAGRLDPARLDGLTQIGVDEISFKKRHHYVTTVVDHIGRRVVWAKEGKDSGTLGAFFEELGPERIAKLEAVTLDMSGAFKKAITKHAAQVELIFDRFHVQKLVSEALDEVRRQTVRELEGEEAKTVKGTRYALLKNPWNLTRKQGQKLHDIQVNNKKIYRAYLLKETLAKALDYLQPKRAERALREWLSWAAKSQLSPMVKVSRTIRKHFDGILAYVRHRLTNGITEGFNRRARMIATRAYGFHGSKPLISMFFLCCGGIKLHPPIPQPT